MISQARTLMLLVESGLKPQQRHRANQHRSHTWKAERGTMGKCFLSLAYVNRNGNAKEAAKYLVERRRKKSQSLFIWTCDL